MILSLVPNPNPNPNPRPYGPLCGGEKVQILVHNLEAPKSESDIEVSFGSMNAKVFHVDGGLL